MGSRSKQGLTQVILVIRKSASYFLFLTLFVSCTNVKRITKVPLENGNYFEIFYFPYFTVERSVRVRDCEIFNTQIKNKQHKIKEELIWYSCDSMLPLKVYFTSSADSTHNLVTNLLIVDTTGNAKFPLSDEEQKAFWAMNAYFSDHHLPAYSVHGFKNLSKQDSTRRLPFLSKAVLMEYYKRK